jgi:hypothetical protein
MVLQVSDLVDSLASEPTLYNAISIEQLFRYLQLIHQILPEIRLFRPRSNVLPSQLPDNLVEFISAVLDLTPSLVNKLWVTTLGHITTCDELTLDDSTFS